MFKIKGEEMKNITLTICFLLICNNVYAKTFSVESSNKGKEGKILVHNGKTSQGKWTNPKNIETLQGEKGDIGKTGNKGKNGERGIQGEKGLQGKGLKDRYEIQGEIRISDTQRTSTAIYGIHDFNNDIQTVGIKFTWKLGKSYEEKLLDELEQRIKELENNGSDN